MEIEVHGGVHVETGAPLVKIDVIGCETSMSFMMDAENAREFAADLTQMSIVADMESEKRNGNR